MDKFMNLRGLVIDTLEEVRDHRYDARTSDAKDAMSEAKKKLVEILELIDTASQAEVIGTEAFN